MSGEPDLSSAIAEVQAALERLRIAADRSASASQGWSFVDSPPEASSAPHPVGGSSDRVPSPHPPTRVASRPAPPAAPTRAETASSFAACPRYCLDLCSRLTSSSLSASERAKRAWVAGLWAREVLDGRWATPLPSPSWVFALLCTLCFAALIWQSLPATAHIPPSVEQLARWRIPPPSATPSHPWLKPVCIATLLAFLCLTCVSDACTCRSAYWGGKHLCPQLDRRVQHWGSPTGFVDAAAAPRGWLLMRPACRLATGGPGRDGSSFANSPVRALSLGHRPGYRGGRAGRGDAFRLGYPGFAVGSRDRGLSFDEAFTP